MASPSGLTILAKIPVRLKSSVPTNCNILQPVSALTSDGTKLSSHTTENSVSVRDKEKKGLANAHVGILELGPSLHTVNDFSNICSFMILPADK